MLQVVCPAPEVVCPSDGDVPLYCSFGGTCLGSSLLAPSAAPSSSSAADSIIPVYSDSGKAGIVTSSVAQAAPWIPPTLSLNGPTTVSVMQNTAYGPCIGVSTSNCELGATATQNATGDLNSQILACQDQASENS